MARPGSCRIGLRSLALERRRRQALERVRGQQDEGEEGGADHPLHGERVGAQPRGQRAAEDGDERAERRQDQRPQQHRAFVVAPHAGELVDRRRGAVRILGDVEHREVGGQMRPGERGEGERDEDELAERGARPDRHQRRDRRAARRRAARSPAPATARRRGSSAKWPASTIMAWRAPSCQRPCFLSASTTSRGM